MILLHLLLPRPSVMMKILWMEELMIVHDVDYTSSSSASSAAEEENRGESETGGKKKAGHETTDKLTKPTVVDTATKISSSDHLAESNSRHAEWEELIRQKQQRKLKELAVYLHYFQFGCRKGYYPATFQAEKEDEEDSMSVPSFEEEKSGCWSCFRYVFRGLRRLLGIPLEEKRVKKENLVWKKLLEPVKMLFGELCHRLRE
ncbi:uncharacterized protein [Periplaneta americana]|uniref:uncharacterized protein isoform X2 n=1 Tax=Periplaneta americana TaxID=6978 RepID=UPI0037E842C8